MAYVLLAGVLLILAAAACSFSSPEKLNDGKGGTRTNPVPARTYAHTIDYDIRVLSVEWDWQSGDESDNERDDQLRVQYQVRCGKSESEVCTLEDIRKDISLVDSRGVLYEPVFSSTIEDLLEGDILGDGGEKTGWVAYQIPSGIEIIAAVAAYGEDQRVFFQLR